MKLVYLSTISIALWACTVPNPNAEWLDPQDASVRLDFSARRCIVGCTGAADLATTVADARPPADLRFKPDGGSPPPPPRDASPIIDQKAASADAAPTPRDSTIDHPVSPLDLGVPRPDAMTPIDATVNAAPDLDDGRCVNDAWRLCGECGKEFCYQGKWSGKCAPTQSSHALCRQLYGAHWYCSAVAAYCKYNP